MVIVDNFDPYYSRETKLDNIRRVRDAGEFVFYENDIRDVRMMRGLFRSERPSVIFHLAAMPGVRASFEHPKLYEDVNVGGTKCLLRLSAEFGAERVILASSSSVYGVLSPMPMQEDCRCLNPISPYGASKLAAERLCAETSEVTGLKTICYRLFSVYGNRQRPDLVISRFTSLIYSEQPLTIFGTGDMARDYTYVNDAIQGLIAGIDYPSLHDVFNLGSSRPITLTTLVGILSGILEMRPELRVCAGHPADPPGTWADISKARRHLGYRPKIDIEVGLRRFVDWYLQQPRQTLTERD